MALDKCKDCKFFLSGATNCAGCPETIALHAMGQVVGKDTVVVNVTGCTEIFSTQYPTTAWGVNYMHVAFENAGAVAAGVEAAFKKMDKRHQKANIIAIAGDGGTVDIGLQSLSGMLERGHRILYVMFDNEAYMNCLALSTEIMTKDGLRNIIDIKKGDMIYAFNQKTRKLVLKKCTGIYDNGKKEVFEINTLHHTIKATENHPFLIVKKQGRGKSNVLIWKTIAELKKDDQIIVLKNLPAGKSFPFNKIKMVKKGDYKVNRLNELNLPSKSSPDLMEFFGLFVGDGWVRLKKGEVGFALPEEKTARNRLLMLQERLFDLKPKLTKNYIYFNSVNLTKFINSLGFNKPAKEKTVPSWIFTLPTDEKEAFIRGLMLSDGYRINNSSRIVSASFDLLKKTRLLLQTMGYRVGKIHKQIKKKGTRCVYRKLLKDSEYGYICFSERNDWNIKKYQSQYKYNNFLIGNKTFETEKIQSIKSIGIEPTLDLRIKGEHNFIANGIVVHNTGIQRSGATPRYAITTTSPAGKVIPGNKTWKKPIIDIVAAHQIPYVASASIGNVPDLQEKVKKALAVDGPSFISIHCPCPPGWRFPSANTIIISKKALTTGMWLLYEIENGKLKINKKPEFEPVKEYLQMQGRFKHLTDKEITEIQGHLHDEYKRLQNLEKTPGN